MLLLLGFCLTLGVMAYVPDVAEKQTVEYSIAYQSDIIAPVAIDAIDNHAEYNYSIVSFDEIAYEKATITAETRKNWRWRISTYSLKSANKISNLDNQKKPIPIEVNRLIFHPKLC